MTSTPRICSVLIGLAVVGLVLASAAPVYAAPSTGAPASWTSVIGDWLENLVDLLGFGLERTTGRDSAAPNMDPDGVAAVPPVLPLSPDGYSSPQDDDGETAPNMDPDG